jgi:hypothetical protein
MSAEQPINVTAATKDMPGVKARPAEQPPQHGRSLVGFYVALGFIAVLVGMGVWLWTPITVLRLERQVHHPEAYLQFANHINPRAIPVMKLVKMGPVARAALRRLLNDPSPEVRMAALVDMKFGDGPTWYFHLVIEAASRGDDEMAQYAIEVASERAGRGFRDWTGDWRVERQNLLDWWEREGKAKYGGGGK